MAMLNHLEIEREITHLLKTISVDEDFDFKLPLEINATTNGITYGIPVVINMFSDAFYFQIAFGDYKRSNYMQISLRLLIGEVVVDNATLALCNKLNTKLLFAKTLLNEDEAVPYLTIEHDFSALNLEQVSEAIYDFMSDLIDDDVSPLIETLLKKMIDTDENKA